MLTNKKSFGFYFSLIIFRLLLDFCYFNIVVKYFYYNGYVVKSTFFSIILSWLLLFYFSFYLKKLFLNIKETFSNITLYVLSIISIVPFTTLLCGGLFYSRFIGFFVLYWSIMFLFYFRLCNVSFKKVKVKFGKKVIDDGITWIVGIISLFTVLYISYKYTNFRFNFSLFNAYELRSSAKEFIPSGIIGYLFMASRVVNIVFLSYCLNNKKYLLSFVFFITQMLSYGIDGLKTTFFITFLVIVIFIVSNRKNFHFNFYYKGILYGLSGICFLGIIENYLFKSFRIVNVLVRRVLLDPVYLNFCYVDFFSKNIPDFFKSSFLKIFGFQSNYQNLGNIIGYEYFGRVNENCNNGLIADAVTNLGALGILIMPFLLILVLKFLDVCANGLDKKIFIVVAIYFAILLSNTFLLPALVTHGIFISGIIMYFMSFGGEFKDETKV